MSLNQAAISVQIGDLVAKTEPLALADAKKEFNDGLAKIIVDAIKSATVTVPALSITTNGTAATQQGPPAPVPLSSALS